MRTRVRVGRECSLSISRRPRTLAHPKTGSANCILDHSSCDVQEEDLEEVEVDDAIEACKTNVSCKSGEEGTEAAASGIERVV